MRLDPVTQTAWEVLLQDSPHTLPVKPTQIARRKGFFVFTYLQYRQVTGRSLEELALHYGLDGFTLQIHGHFVIFYNPTNPVPRIRWTLAHELGHILLGHADFVGPASFRKEGSAKEEREADRFAAELLCPGILAHLSGAVSAAQLAEIFDLSAQAAGIQWEKLSGYRWKEVFSGEGKGDIEDLPRSLAEAFSTSLRQLRETGEGGPSVTAPGPGRVYGRL